MVSNFAMPRTAVLLLLLLLVALSCSPAPSNCAAEGVGGDGGAPIRDGEPGSRAHYRSSSWAESPTAPRADSSSEEEERRVDAALAGRDHLSPAELASAARSILPPGMIAKPLKDDEVYRILRNFVAVENRNNASLPQKPSPAEVSSALASAAAGRWLTRSALLSLARNASGAFMALADSSQGGVVNKEHEYNAWSARDDPFFEIEAWSGGNSSSPLVPRSIDRAFDKADWTGDQRRGINASAAERLRFGDRASELFLAMDQGGEGGAAAGDGLRLDELSERMPADTPAPPPGSPAKRHPVYSYTPANGKKLAQALLRAFDADSDQAISRGAEAAGVVEALAALRAGEGPRSRAGRRLIAALVLGDAYSPRGGGAAAATISEKEVVAYAARARETGEMAVSPPLSENEKGAAAAAAVARWFEKANAGRRSSSVDDFVALAPEDKESG